MRFVAVKSEAKQASAVIFRTRDLLVGQRTQAPSGLGYLLENRLTLRKRYQDFLRLEPLRPRE